MLEFDDYPPGGVPKGHWSGLVRGLIAKDGGTGHPEIIDALLCWLQDCNWPGNEDAWPYLLTLGEKVLPHAARILDGDDEQWKYNLLNAMRLWPLEYVRRVAPRLKEFATQNDKEEVNLAAARVLIEKDLLAHDEARDILSRIKEWKPGLDWEIEELRDLLTSREHEKR